MLDFIKKIQTNSKNSGGKVQDSKQDDEYGVKSDSQNLDKETGELSELLSHGGKVQSYENPELPVSDTASFNTRSYSNAGGTSAGITDVSDIITNNIGKISDVKMLEQLSDSAGTEISLKQNELNDIASGSSGQLSAAKQNLDNNQNMIDNTNQAISSEEADRLQTENAAAKTEADINNKQAEKTAKEQDRAALSEKISGFKDTISDLKSKIESLEAALAAAEAVSALFGGAGAGAIAAIKAALEQVKALLDTAEKALEAAEKGLDIANGDYSKILEDLTALQGQLDNARQTLSGVNTKIEELNQQLSVYETAQEQSFDAYNSLKEADESFLTRMIANLTAYKQAADYKIKIIRNGGNAENTGDTADFRAEKVSGQALSLYTGDMFPPAQDFTAFSPLNALVMPNMPNMPANPKPDAAAPNVSVFMHKTQPDDYPQDF